MYIGKHSIFIHVDKFYNSNKRIYYTNKNNLYIFFLVFFLKGVKEREIQKSNSKILSTILEIEHLIELTCLLEDYGKQYLRIKR